MSGFPGFFTVNNKPLGGFVFPKEEWEGLIPPNTPVKKVLLGGAKQEVFFLEKVDFIPLLKEDKWFFTPNSTGVQELKSHTIRGELVLPQNTPSKNDGVIKSQIIMSGALLIEGQLFAAALKVTGKYQSRNMQAILKRALMTRLNQGVPNDSIGILSLSVSTESEVVTSSIKDESSEVFPIKADPFTTSSIFNGDVEKLEVYKSFLDNYIVEIKALYQAQAPQLTQNGATHLIETD